MGADFDLNEYNVRYCVTPEFPNGTYAYFMTVTSSGTPTFPYNVNRYFFGSPTGGTATATETVTTLFSGGPNLQEVVEMSSVDPTHGDATIVWSSVEGATYKVEDSSDLSAWTALTTTQSAASDDVETSYTDTTTSGSPKRFYRVTRTALASYDNGTTTTSNQGISSVSPTSAAQGANNVTLTITLNTSYNPAPPPNNVSPTSVTLTLSGASTITATSFSRNTSTGVITATVSISSKATAGAYTVNAIFGPNTWSLTSGFTVTATPQQNLGATTNTTREIPTTIGNTANEVTKTSAASKSGRGSERKRP